MSFSVDRVEILGLHGRTSLEITLRPEVNILFGRNGSGKTTLLHIIANILNRSIDRFAYLEFQRIRLELSNGHSIALERLQRDPSERQDLVLVQVDDTGIAKIHPELVWEFDEASQRSTRISRTSRPSAASPESFTHHRNIQEAAEKLPVDGAAYFPAFRTMIEAWRSVEMTSARADYPFVPPPPTSPYDTRDVSMTRLARDLFGRFVPEFDYPSVLEIEIYLNQQIRIAEYEIAAASEAILSDAFVGAFAALSEGDSVPDDSFGNSTEEILDRIQQLLKELNEGRVAELSENRQADVYRRLRTMLPSLQSGEQSDTATRVLTVYRDSLEQQVRVQRTTLEPIRTYLDSVNDFLEEKRIVVVSSELEHEEQRVMIEFSDSSKEGLRALSSGERQIVSMLYAVSSLDTRESGIVLIDEPELSLQVEWQRQLIKRMAEQTGGRQLLVCTHAPEIGADYEDQYQVLEPTHYQHVAQ